MVNEYSYFPVFLTTYIFPNISTDAHTHAKTQTEKEKNYEKTKQWQNPKNQAHINHYIKTWTDLLGTHMV